MDDTKEPPLFNDNGIDLATSKPGTPSSIHSLSDDNSNSEDMAPRNKSSRPSTPKQEVDLSKLLNPAEKGELIALVNKVTDGMQKQIVQVFDSTGVDGDAGTARPSFWSKLPAHLKDLSLGRPEQQPLQPQQQSAQNAQTRPTAKNKTVAARKENLPPGQPQKTATCINDNTNLQQDASNFVNKIEEEDKSALSPRLQELKKEILAHFKKWQTAVQKRVGDISVKRTNSSNSNDAQNGQSSSAGLNRGGGSNRKRRGGGSKPQASAAVEADPGLIRLYPPTPTTLYSLPLEKRSLLLHSLLLLLISLEHYSAYSRVLLLNIASSLHLPLRVLAEDEVRVAKSLSQIAKDINPDELTQKKAEENKTSKKWKVGLASVAGAAVIGVTGGLAAPLVAAGIGTVLGGLGLGTTAAAGLLGAMAESSLLVGSLFGIYGARATGKAMDQYAKDVQDFAFIPLRGSIGEDSEIGKVSPDHRRLRVVLGISGWLTGETDVVNPWRALGDQSEVYAVRWELESLLKMGNSLETVVKSTAWSMAKKEIIARTIFASLFEALWPLGLLRISKIIDNPWSMCMVRADKAGAVLADIIMNKVQGDRGVTLIGYSLGARVIYVCLTALAERRAFGLVENVVMMGTPCPSEARVWCAMKSVVSGRFVNVYSQNDYILGFLYRTSSIQYGVAGLQKIEGIDGVENVDVSAKVSGHLRYQYLVGSILKHIGWEDIDLEQVARDEAALNLMEEKSREREKKRDAVELANEANELEKEIKQKNDQEVIRTRIRKIKGKK
ncbi:hypothetical protein QBC46DRAFT_335646 [Diplogelasinospora grovesii]|uniref:DUF726-domain-containing protein n=1 Tax=Diplogelasinospora grovesii TaxID=303347 RepID=A0AAN6NHZ0_9PEZI|nr:hypothetical protein QBC46DRAFT_335646 [Diplogelasinospora grovesii]